MRRRIGPSDARCNSRAHTAASLARPKAITKLSPSPLFDRPHAVVSVHHARKRAVESMKGSGHLFGSGFPQPRGTLDVGQQQRHRSGRYQFAHAQIAPAQRRRVNLAHASQPVAFVTREHRRDAYDRAGNRSYIRPPVAESTRCDRWSRRRRTGFSTHPTRGGHHDHRHQSRRCAQRL